MTTLLILAHRREHAQYYAQRVLRIGPTEWKFVERPYDVYGCRGAKMIVLYTPCFKPTYEQRKDRRILLETCKAHGIVITEEVELP